MGFIVPLRVYSVRMFPVLSIMVPSRVKKERDICDCFQNLGARNQEHSHH